MHALPTAGSTHQRDAASFGQFFLGPCFTGHKLIVHCNCHARCGPLQFVGQLLQSAGCGGDGIVV